MNVRNCKKCGRIFNYVTGVPMCQTCKDALEEKFQEVKKYVQDHPGVGIPEVSEVCEVEPSQIRQWIREERLEFAEGSGIGVDCEKCGATIRTGRFCQKCKNTMVNELGNMYQRPKLAPKPAETRSDARMRFLE